MPIEFRRADTTKRPPARLIEAVWGGEKVGKTVHALQFPDPLYFFNFDYGVQEHLESGRYSDREIYLEDFRFPKGQMDLREMKKKLEQDFEPKWIAACEAANERGGSVVLDTGDELWGIVGDTMTGEIREQHAASGAKDTQLDWRNANRFMDSILKRPLQYPRVNACYIQRASEQRDSSGKLTGALYMHGFKTTKYIVEVVLHLEVVRTLNPATKKLEPNFQGVIEACRFPNGQQVVGRALAETDYDTVMNFIS